MSHNKSNVLTGLLFLFLFWLNACENTSGVKPIRNETVYPTVIENIRTMVSAPSTASPTEPRVIATADATLSTVQEASLVDALESEDCELPCYMGITPGKTAWSEAQQILSNLGAKYREGYDFSEDGMLVYYYFQFIGRPSVSKSTPTPEVAVQPLGIYQALAFTVGDSVVQRISVSIYTFDQATKLHKYWSRYSPPQIFIRLGNPDGMYLAKSSRVQDGSGMLLVYESRGIIMEFSGVREGVPICPSFEAEGYSSWEFILTYTDSDRLSLFPTGYERVPSNHDIWLPVVEIFGISQEELYSQLMSDPSACFEIQ